MLEKQRPRRKTRAVKVGPLVIGGEAPVIVQSMTKTDTRDVGSTVAQIEQMVATGCELVRLAVPDQAAATALAEIAKRLPQVPLAADIHFQHRLAPPRVGPGLTQLALQTG